MNFNTMNEYNLKGSSTSLLISEPRTEFLIKSFSYSGAKIWNQIPKNIRNSVPYVSFCQTFSPSTFVFTKTSSSMLDRVSVCYTVVICFCNIVKYYIYCSIASL